MRFELLLTLLLAAPHAAGAGQPATPARKPVARTPATKPSAPGPLASEEEKAVYAIGLSIWRSLSPLDLAPSEVAIVQRAIGDAAAGKPAFPLEEFGGKLEAFGRARAQRVVVREKPARRPISTRPPSSQARSGPSRASSSSTFSRARAPRPPRRTP